MNEDLIIVLQSESKTTENNQSLNNLLFDRILRRIKNYVFNEKIYKNYCKRTISKRKMIKL
jgi:hypothetical protein